MINSPSWFIGVFFLWLMLTVVGNIIEKVDILTENQVALIQSGSTVETVTTKDPNTGAASTFGNLNFGVVEAFVKALKCDFSWLHNEDGSWNEYMWIWALLYYGVMAGIVIGLLLTIRYKT